MTAGSAAVVSAAAAIPVSAPVIEEAVEEIVEELEEFEMSESILEDGTKIYMPTLLSILKFKAREVSLLEDKQKEEDLNKLVNAIKSVYDKNLIDEILNEYNVSQIKR